jgi:prophage DNA circulation protein
MSLFISLLHQAYWRGVPFKVDDLAVRKGRKVAIHDYPFRDGGWPEDMGRALQVFHFTGHLVGDLAPVMQLAIDAACEVPGPGVLVHPSLGAVRVSLLSASSAQRKDRSRVIDLQFEFIEHGTSLFPSVVTATIGKVLAAAASALPALATDLIGIAVVAAAAGAAAFAAGGAAVLSFAGAAKAVAADPAALAAMAAGLSAPSVDASFGRYAGGGALAALPRGTTISGLQAQLAQQRGVVATAGAAAVAATSGFTAQSAAALVTSIAAVAEGARATMTSPVDQLRTMLTLSNFTYSSIAAGPAAAVRDALAATCRRCAVVSLARASAACQPVSYDDAAAIRCKVAAALDIEISAAGDAGNDATYLALRQLRAAVIQDLTARGAALPLVKTVTLPSVLPSLVVAQLLYRDASRSDQVAARARAVHPAFCPVTMQVLAT